MTRNESEKDNLMIVALGGNAILKPNQSGTAEEQFANLRITCKHLAEIIAQGRYQVVLTHGNGPQIGNILLQNEAANDKVAPMPVDICGAESQGLIGYMISQTLRNQLNQMGLGDISIISVITQTLVSEADPAFKHPTKPVGPFYDKKEAERLWEEKGYKIVNDANRGWRRVVASPDSVTIIESTAIKQLVQMGTIVIACGGGGVPVISDNNKLIGQEAVIDKDLASERLAEDVGASIFVILTDVEQVMLHYGTGNEKGVAHMSAEQARKYIEEGHFAQGSMEPKVRACIRFVKAGGEKAIITSLERIKEGLGGAGGTTISLEQ